MNLEILKSAFSAFMEAYPPRVPNPRAPAEMIFRKIVTAKMNPVQPDDLIRAAQAYREEVRKLEMDLKFVPHARTWLMQRRFEDYLPSGQAESITPPSLRDPPQELWQQALCQVFGVSVYQGWFAKCALSCDRNGAILSAPTRFSADYIQNNFLEELLRILKQKCGIESLSIEVRRD
jgi:hypothetical protein